MDHGRSLDPEIASIVASAMKDWAVENGQPILPLVPANDWDYCR